MKNEQAKALQVGDTVYFTLKNYRYTLEAVICHDHIFDSRTTSVKVVKPFEKRFLRIETKKLFTSKEAAEVAERMKR